MTESRPKPLAGALLGLVLGLLVMALLTVLGVLPPDRLPLFGIVGLTIIASSALLTQRLALAKGRMITVIVIGALLGGVALTGIPEIMRGGSMSSGCMATATSSLEAEPVSPPSTTAIDPFRVTTTDTIAWTTTTDGAVTEARARLSVLVGGFAIPLRNATFAEAPDLTEWSGETSVESQLDEIQDASGMLLTGTYHLAATVDTDAGECAGDAYLRVEPVGTFSGVLLALLWSLLAVVVVTIVVLAIIVRRSINDSDATLAMVGTSAIPGGTSTTPPASPRRAPSPEAREGSRAADAPSSASGRERRPSSGADGRGEKTAADRPSGSDRSAPQSPGRLEAADETRHEDGLARSPYAEAAGLDTPATDDTAVPADTAPEEPAPVERETAQDPAPVEEREGVDKSDPPASPGEAPVSDEPAAPDQPVDPDGTDERRGPRST
ncbi:hypothetical protein [Demequina aestuarii]|uniref:hypothetical protein n=1 Tax=Demequina aestuarii TaxID=327095 RepID=UPI000780542C|nr:hypothetical protein [Demequina aestuarii]